MIYFKYSAKQISNYEKKRCSCKQQALNQKLSN